MKTLKAQIVEILERELPMILTEIAFLGQIPKEKGHHQGFSSSQVIKNDSEIIADQILSLFAQDRQKIIEGVEKMKRKGNPELETNQDFGFNQALDQVLQLLKDN